MPMCPYSRSHIMESAWDALSLEPAQHLHDVLKTRPELRTASIIRVGRVTPFAPRRQSDSATELSAPHCSDNAATIRAVGIIKLGFPREAATKPTRRTSGSSRSRFVLQLVRVSHCRQRQSAALYSRSCVIEWLDCRDQLFNYPG